MVKRAKRVLILYTGGTIGMGTAARAGAALSVAPLSAAKLAASVRDRVPELKKLAHCEIETLANRDSAHLGPEDWMRFARHIRSRWSKYDGVVVLHGTDTMAYTASALSFLLRPCLKPVIITGAQRPLAAIRTDARRNLISSVEIAAHGPRPLVNRVSVFFDDRLLQGNRVRKRSASEFSAFDSPRAEPLARVGTRIEFRASPTRGGRGPVLRPAFSHGVAMIHATPAAPYAAMAQRLLPELSGLCLVIYPSGTAPTHDSAFLALLSSAKKRGIPVVAVAEGAGAAPLPSAYAAGAPLIRAGCHWAGAMTPECAYVKMLLILGQSDGRARFKRYWATQLAGES